MITSPVILLSLSRSHYTVVQFIDVLTYLHGLSRFSHIGLFIRDGWFPENCVCRWFQYNNNNKICQLTFFLEKTENFYPKENLLWGKKKVILVEKLFLAEKCFSDKTSTRSTPESLFMHMNKWPDFQRCL